MGRTGHRNRPVDEHKRKMENLLSALRWEKMNIKVSSGTLKVSTSNLNINLKYLWEILMYICNTCMLSCQLTQLNSVCL
jgi:hypothetical protein